MTKRGGKHRHRDNVQTPPKEEEVEKYLSKKEEVEKCPSKKEEVETDDTQRVQVTIELGHTACFRKKQTADGFTHDWSVFVRGPDGSKIQHFIEKVVFNLHDTFNKPKRCVKEPPYQVSESGYASFLLPIDIYFRNKELPKKISFKYDLYLNAEGGPAINHTRCEKLTFQNPVPEFRQKLLKAGGQVQYGSNPQQPFTDLFGPPITPDTGNKRPAGTSIGKDKSSKSKSSSKPSTPQSSTISSSSSSSSGPGTQPIASKEPKSSKSSSSSSSSSTRETIGQKRPSLSSPEQTSGKKMKRSSSTSSTTESSSKHKHKSSSKKKSDKSESDKSESKRKSSSSKHHKDKSEHKDKKKKDKSDSSHSKSSSLSKSMPELKMKNELLSPLHDSPPRSLSPPRSKPDLDSDTNDSDSNSSPKPAPATPKESPISSLSEDEEEMTRKILAGGGEDDSCSSISRSDQEPPSVKPLSSSDSESDDVKSTQSESKSHASSHNSPKVSKNSSGDNKLSPVKSESKSSPVKSETKSSKSKHSSSSSRKSSSSKSEPKSKDSKDKKDRSDSTSSSKHSRSNKDSKVPKEKKEKDSVQVENGIPEKAPNGENIRELLELQVVLCHMTDRQKLQQVANLIGPTGLFKVSETNFSFDLCNIDSDIVKKIKATVSE